MKLQNLCNGLHGWLQLRCSQTIFLDGPSLDGQVRPVYLFRPAELVYLFRLVELGWLTAAGLFVFTGQVPIAGCSRTILSDQPSLDGWLQPVYLSISVALTVLPRNPF